MAKKFKTQENNLIWESYSTPNDQSYADSYNDQSFEDAEDVSNLPSWVNEFDAGDLLAGVYWWASENHGGQWSDGYRALSIAGNSYRPGRMANGPEPESGESFVYDQIGSEEEALAIAEYASEQLNGVDEDAEAIISLAPTGPVEAEMGDDDMFEDDDDLFEDDDDDLDNEIIVKALRKLIKRADILLNHCESDKLDTWMVAKIIKAEDYISDVWNELDDVADFANDGPKDIF